MDEQTKDTELYKAVRWIVRAIATGRTEPKPEIIKEMLKE